MFVGASLAAQNIPPPTSTDAPADFQLTGMVRTAGGAGIPGSTLRVIQSATGKAWISWTDESGKFEFPALPSGHFRVEISQLGFAPVAKEIDLGLSPQAPLGFVAGWHRPLASQHPLGHDMGVHVHAPPSHT